MAAGGLLIGAAVGAVAQGIQAQQAKRAASKIRRRVRRGIAAGEAQAARSLGTTLSSPEFLTATNFIRSFFGIKSDPTSDLLGTLRGEFGDVLDKERAGLGDTKERFARNAAAVPTFQGGTGPLDTLSQDFAKGLRQAQASRGLLQSQAGAAAAASGLTAFRTNLQIGLLPQLLNLAERPSRLRGAVENQFISKEVARATGGAASFGQATPLAVGGGGFGAGAITGAIQGGAAGVALEQGPSGEASGLPSVTNFLLRRQQQQQQQQLQPTGRFV